MMKISTNDKGFTLAETLLAILILTVIGLGGYYVWHNQHKSSAKKTISSTSSNKSTTTSYEGWKTYCDSHAKFCFKYPSDWQAQDQSTGSIISEEIWSPNNDMNAAYLDQPSAPTSYPSFPFYTYSIGNMLSSNSPYKVIEGNSDISNVYSPSIYLADESSATNDKLQVGTTSKVQTFPITDSSSAGHQISFNGGPAGNNSFTVTQANQWYNSANAKALKKILESTYLE